MRFNDFAASDSPDDLKEDLLQLHHARSNCLVDLGWYEDGKGAGEYLILVLRGDFEGERLAEFGSADRHKIVAELERLLALYR